MPSIADRAKRIQLFQTVSDLHSAGMVSLSRQDKSRIEAETRDLIQKSIRNRSASKAPEGFEDVLNKLRDAEDADAAYGIVVDFLKANDLLGGEKDEGGEGPPKAPKKEKSEKDEDDSEEHEKSESGEEEEEEHESEEHEKSESPEEEKAEHEKGKKDEADKGGKPPFGGKGPSNGGKPPFGKGAPEKPEGIPSEMPEGKEMPPMDKMEAQRRALVRRAGDQERGKGIGDLQKQKKEVKTPSSDEMGIEEASDMTLGTGAGVGMGTGTEQGMRANKISVKITPGRNLVVAHADHGPVFYARPAVDYRKDLTVLQRLAHKVHDLAVRQGFKAAAVYCNAKLLREAGVDDDVTTVNRDKPISPETKDSLEGAEDVNLQERGDKPGTSQDDIEVVTREKPDGSAKNVTTDVIAQRKALALAAAKKRWIARQKRQGADILEGNETVTQEKPDGPGNDVRDDAKDVNRDKPRAAPGSVIDDQEDVIRATANLKELYKNRAAKRVSAEKEAFVRRFVRAARIASTRMLLNHDEHPIKSAAMDVLTSDSIVFSNGEKFAAMDEPTAVELIELIHAEGHKAFIDRLLEKAADLLEKDDRYLADVEADMKSLAPRPVSSGAIVARTAGSRQRRSANVRREAAEGNFSRKGNEAPASSLTNDNGSLREALGGSTLLGRRVGRING